MEDSYDTIVETREELMVSPTGEGNPTQRTAHFLKPSITSIDELPSLQITSRPPSLDPKKTPPLKVTYNGWRFPQKKWNEWVEKMASSHEPTWKSAGILEPIMSSRYEIHRNNELVLGIADKWCPETATFVFPWGESTITLEDVVILMGYSVLGSPVFSPIESEEMKVVQEKLIKARSELRKSSAKKPGTQTWLKKFMDSGSEIEHEAFLALWLSRYVFPHSYDVVTRSVLPIAVHLGRGIRIALAPAILASVYRDLKLLKEASFNSGSGSAGEPNTLTIWSPFQLVQVWAWERFPELQPKPNLIANDEPRLARWHKVKLHNVENVRVALDSAKESFSWRPYTKTLENWRFPKFYKEKEMWVWRNSEFLEELQCFARCLRVSMLVGLDCMELYMPHRVALQFGFDQDLPGCVFRSCESPEIAWSDYCRPIRDVKLYVPQRLFEADVTTRYLEWWNNPVVDLQENVSMVSVEQKRKNGADSFKCSKTALKSSKLWKECAGEDSDPKVPLKNSKISQQISKGNKKGMSVPDPSVKSLKTNEQNSEGKKNQLNASASSILPPKNLEKSAEALKGRDEHDDVSPPPGFSPKTSKKKEKMLIKEHKDNAAVSSLAYSPKGLEKSAQLPKEKSKSRGQSSSPEFTPKKRKTLPLSLVIAKESSFSKRYKVEQGNSIMDTKLAINGTSISIDNHYIDWNKEYGNRERRTPDRVQAIPYSAADHEIIKNTEPSTQTVGKAIKSEPVVEGSEATVVNHTDNEVLGLGLEARITRLERVIAELKARKYWRKIKEETV